MPIYEYACPDCDHEFEALQKVSAPRLSTCPQCELDNLKKKVSATSFLLKGGGWYKDHYGLKSPGASSSGDGEDSASSSDDGASTSSTSTTPSTPASDSSSSTTSTTSSGSSE